MEFLNMEITVNDILKEELVKITNTLLPPGARGDVQRVRRIEQCVSQIIDDIGKMSTLEQGLTKVITSSEKLRNAPTQSVYLLKDSAANSGQGQVIGLLKVGKKHLFLFDDKNEVREFEPVCILDFFVRSEYQRNGHGRRLFDYMLQMEGVRPDQMAVDGPSLKMENFLRKNYGLHQLVKQSNNFAVTPTFFTSVKELGEHDMHEENVNCGRCLFSRSRKEGGRFYRRSSSLSKEPYKITFAHPSVQPTHNQPEAAVDHYAGMRLTSCVGNIIHGDGDGGFIGATTYEAPPVSPKGAPVVAPEETPAVEPEETPAVAPEETPSVAPEETPALSPEHPPDVVPAGRPTPRRDSQVNKQGYFDLKYYHNKLW